MFMNYAKFPLEILGGKNNEPICQNLHFIVYIMYNSTKAKTSQIQKTLHNQENNTLNLQNKKLNNKMLQNYPEYQFFFTVSKTP